MYFGQGGPVAVNQNLVRCLKDKVFIPTIRNRYLRFLQDCFNIFRSDIIIFSGIFFWQFEIYLAKVLRKKIIFIMHGCCHIEVKHASKIEDEILKCSDLILCVSEIFRNQMAIEYPQYAYKMSYLMNGVNWDEIDKMKARLPLNMKRDPNRIILFGGGRIVKKNYYVCRAVQEINEEDHANYHVDVYGYYRDSDDSQKIASIPCVTFHHVIPHDQVNVELAKSQLFIQNSSFEPFGLAVMDALLCGCDLLISRYVGAQDIIGNKEESDLIKDPCDINEIKSKIRYVLKHSNNYRLLTSVDRESTSIQTAAQNLLGFCARI